MASKVHIGIILILMLANGATSKPARRLHLEIFETECIILTALVSTFNCTLHHVTPGVQYFNDGIALTKDINNSLDMRVRVDGQYLNSDKIMTFLDYKFDICQNLQTAFKNFFMHALMQELRRSSNMPYKCPFKANIYYKAENFTLTKDIFPPYTPEMNFTVTLNFIYKNVEFARQITTAAIDMKMPKFRNITRFRKI